MEWIFVRPENEGQVTDDHSSAFNLMKENDLNPSWMTTEDCLSIKAEKVKALFFVCDPFSGRAFEFLKKLKCRILGPKCIKHGIDNGKIQNSPYPVYNTAMRGLHISYTGFKAGKRQEITEKIKYMGGHTDGQFTAEVTHLVADEVGSKKYQVAKEYNTPVMLSEWVFECWRRSQHEDVVASDSQFLKYLTPIFKGLVITLTQADVEERKRIQNLVESNGGTYTGELRSRHATHLIAWQPTGKKFIFASQWRILCVTVDWLDECIAKSYKVKEEPYILKKTDSQPTTSSPRNPSKDFVLNNLSTSSIVLSPSSSSTTINETMASTRNSSIYKPNDQERVATSALDNLEMSTIYRAGSTFLDGCRIFLLGFDNMHVEKIRRIINLGGGTRLNQLSESISHCIINSEFSKIDDVISKLESEKWHPKVVKIEWLVDSCLAGFTVDEKPYVLWEPSISKMLPVENIKEILKNTLDTSVKEDEKILSQYLDNDSQETNFNDKLKLEAINNFANESSLSNNDVFEDKQPNKIFHRLTMTVIGFDKDNLSILKQTIKENGGLVLRAEDGDQVPDYTIVPIEGIKDLINVSKIATNVWLQACAEKGQIIPLNSDSLFQPINFDMSLKPLAGCVLCISQFLDSERDCLSLLAQLLGAKYQDTLVRKANLRNNLLASTHLICKEAEGGKYIGAIRWGIPAVSKNWLTDCAIQGKWLPEKQYSVRKNEDPKTPLISSTVATPSTSSNEIHSENGKDVLSGATNSTVFTFNKLDMKTPQTVKRKDANITRSIEKLHKIFTPTTKPKRVMQLMKDKQKSTGGKNNSDSVKLNTPSRILNITSPSKHFEPKLTFSPDDCLRKSSRDSLGSLEVFCRENFQSAKHQTKSFGALANVKRRESGAFFPVEIEKIGPLRGVVLGVSKKLRSEHSKFNDIVAALGGDYRWTFDKTCTHFVFQGKATENWSDLKQARNRGIPIVAPEWLQACFEKKERVNENAYPSNFNPKMTLDISVSQIERPKRSESDKHNESQANESSLCETEEDSIDEKRTSEEPSEVISTGKTADALVRNIGEILAITDTQNSSEKNRQQKITSPKSSTPSGEEALKFSFNKSSDLNDNLGAPSQSIPIVWDCPNNAPKQTVGTAGVNETSCIEDGEETQLEYSEIPEESKQETTSLVDNKDSNKENKSDMLEEETEDNNEELENADESFGIPPSFMLSGFGASNRVRNEDLIESLGGMVSKQQFYDENCTHLIVNQPSRNEKCLASIASGKWMLHESYLKRCKDEKRFVEEELHEWGAEGMKTVLAKLHPQMRKIAITSRQWRLKLQKEDERKPFSDWNVIIYTDQNRYNSFKRVLEAGGAQISTCTFPFNDPAEVTHAFLELQQANSSKVDLAALIDAKIPCLKPEFISTFLMEKNPNIQDFYIPEVQTKMNSKSESGVNLSKRKSGSLNGNNKRNRQV